MNRYRVLIPSLFQAERKQGDVFEYEFPTAENELAILESGLIEIVPRTYKVLGPSTVYETEPGETFEKALTMGAETHLIDGGFIERADPPEPALTPKRKQKQKEEK